MTTTPSVSDIAEALETALESIVGLRTFPYLPDQFTPPVALVSIDEVVYHGAFAFADVVHTFTVFVIVSRASDRSAAQAVEDFMSQAGDNSIRAALEADPTLNGVVSTLLVEKAGPVAPIVEGEAIYLSVPFTVTVHA